MKNLKNICVFLSLILILGLCGCQTQPQSAHPYLRYNVAENMAQQFYFPETLEDMMKIFTDEETGKFEATSCLARVKVTGVGTNVFFSAQEYSSDIHTFSSHTETPVEIKEIYEIGEDVSLQAGDHITIFEQYFIQEEAVDKEGNPAPSIVSLYDVTPLVNGNEFYVFLTWNPAPYGNVIFGEFWSTIYCYPVKNYNAFEEYEVLQLDNYEKQIQGDLNRAYNQ